MKGYLDTCLISTIVRSDLKENEQLALIKINNKFLANEVELFVSEHVEEELNKIPLQFRKKHLNVFGMFTSAPKATVGGITRMGLSGGPVANPKRRKMNALQSLLPDKGDAWHLFITSSNRIPCFVTADVKTVIKPKNEIINICGVETLLPSEFLVYCDNETT